MRLYEQNFGSFRDPAGLVWEEGEKIYRTVHSVGKDDYQHFVESGLAKQLQEAGWLIPFTEEETPAEMVGREDIWKFLRVEKVPFLS